MDLYSQEAGCQTYPLDLFVRIPKQQQDIKMKQYYNLFLSFTLLLIASACEDGFDIDDVEIANGYALSAGTSTIFVNSSKAYDSNADWVTGNNLIRFYRGDKLYDDVRTSSNGQGGGLGPVYAGYSCGSCHRNAGRTRPTLWSEGGSGNYGFSSMLVYISRKNGAFFQDYGRVLHDQAIYGVKPEGKLSVEYTYESFSRTVRNTNSANRLTPYPNGMPKKSNRKICFVPSASPCAM